MPMKNTRATRQAVSLVLLLGLILLASTLTSLHFGLQGIGEEYRGLAAEMGRSFYQAINTMRSWNLELGGVLVQDAGRISPNPALPEPLRTVVSVDGQKLVRINHAHMTRLLSELLTRERGVHLHITSLTPLRADNFPDDWERRALARFSTGDSEFYEVVQESGAESFRYMAPLRLTSDCIPCHAGENRGAGAVRGGISVTLPYAPFTRLMSRERRQLIAAHAALFCLAAGMLLLTGRRLYRSVASLQDSLARIRRLEGLLPICANCKKIRREGGDWRKPRDWIHVEKYIQDRTDAEFTHGLCPDCSHGLYPELFPTDAPNPQ